MTVNFCLNQFYGLGLYYSVTETLKVYPRTNSSRTDICGQVRDNVSKFKSKLCSFYFETDYILIIYFTLEQVSVLVLIFLTPSIRTNAECFFGEFCSVVAEVRETAKVKITDLAFSY